jgi:osmoprotectant transport system ATP-binding protein
MPPAPTDAAIQFADVTFERDGRALVSGLSLALEAGSITAVVGRSGAGKTTLLKLINGLVLPTAGTVRIDGRETREWDGTRLRRRIGYVIQEVGLFPHMTVEENVAVVPRLEAWSPDAQRARAHELLELVGLAPGIYAQRRPHELSGGQRQRVGIARALAVHPPILLMDEPFGALDPITRADVRDLFLQLHARLQTTVVLVTHDMAEALTLGTQVGVMQDGRLVACDAPDRIAATTDADIRRLLDTVPTGARRAH